MSERYKKLYHLEHRFYASHAPVLIESGSLLLEQQSNAMLCQLCFRNIQDKPIKSLRAVVQMLDADGEPLGNPVDHRYQDLDLKREEDCGRDVAIVLPSLQAASFSARVSQVSFADGEVWTDGDARWRALPEQFTLEDHFVSYEELDRFLRRFGQDCSFAPLETEELWFCTCGAVNANAENRCHRCSRRRSALLGKGPDPLSPEELEEASFHAPSEQDPSPGRRRGLILGAAGLVLLGLLALLFLPRLKALSEGIFSPSARESVPVAAASGAAPAPTPEPTKDELQDAYQRALTTYTKAEYASPEEAHEMYSSALEAFEALGDFEDSPDRAQQCRDKLQEQREAQLQADFEAAQALLERGRYAEARDAFLALGDYGGSAELAKEAVYRRALALYHFVEGHDVRGVKASLGVSAAEESLVSLPREQLLRMGSAEIRELEDCFGADPIRLVPADPSDPDMKILQESVADLFLSLGDYRDSAELAARLPEMIDRSEDFFALCAAGKLQEAQDWLNAWERPFDDRELWMERLQRYLPFCQDWVLLSGDPSLVYALEDSGEKAYAFRTQVFLTRDGAELRFLLHEGDVGPGLYADLGSSLFLLHRNNAVYQAYLGSSGGLSLIKMREGDVLGGVEYARA